MISFFVRLPYIFINYMEARTLDYDIRKAVNLGQCKIDDFEQFDQRWVLKYKKNPDYIQFLMNSILEYKDDIFLYIQKYYRFFMKDRAGEVPVFEIHMK